MTTAERELELFRVRFGRPECTLDDTLSDLGFDSLTYLELLVYIEDRTGHELELTTLEQFATVADVAELLMRND